MVRLFVFAILFFMAQLSAQEVEELPQDDPYADLPDFSFFEEESLDSNSAWQTEAKLRNKTGAGGKIFRSDDEKTASNLDNRLELRSVYLFSEFELEASATLMRQPDNTSKRLNLVTSFHVAMSNDRGLWNSGIRVPPELAQFSFGFRQLYASFFAELAGGDLELSLGKQAYAQGVSIYFNPMNYLDDSGSFFDEKNNLQVLLALAWPSVTLRLRYMPVLRFHKDSELQPNILNADPETYSSWEYAFSFIESRNRRQLLSLEAAIFLGQANFGLAAYVMEKKRYDWDSGFYGAFGASVRLPLNVGNQYFQLYSEGLLGTGMSKLGQLKESGLGKFPNFTQPPPYLWYDADLDQLQFRGLLGLQWSPLRNLELYLEYRYDGSASQQLERYLDGMDSYNEHSNADPRQALFWQGSIEREVFAHASSLSQHIVALSLVWRNIADYFDLQSSYFLSLPDSSSSLLFKGTMFLLERQLQIYLESNWFLASFAGRSGAFGSVPYLGSLEIGLEIER